MEIERVWVDRVGRRWKNMGVFGWGKWNSCFDSDDERIREMCLFGGVNGTVWFNIIEIRSIE